MAAEAIALPQALDGRDVLVVPAGTDVLRLARAWFPDAVWTQRPTEQRDAVVRPMTGARFRGVPVAEPEAPLAGVMRLAATVDLHGPRPLPQRSLASSGLGPQPVDLYELSVAAVDEDDTRDVGRAWLLAAARRAGGAVVPAGRTEVVVPDGSDLVDLTLWTAVPMSVDEALALVRPALAGGRLGEPRVGPAGHGPAPFSIPVAFEYDGSLVVELSRPTRIPAVLTSIDWRDHGPWAYRVVWASPPDTAEVDPTSPMLAIARGRMRPVVARAVSALWRAAGGTVVDAGGFVVTPDELRDQASQR